MNKKQRIIRAIRKPEIIKNFIAHRLFKIVTKKILNNGERFDPNLFKRFKIGERKDQVNRYEFIKKLLSKNDSVLDIACGTGYGAYELAPYCLNITGVDAAQEAINYANKKYQADNTKFIQTNLNNYNELADIVVSLETIEHINQPLKVTLNKLLSLAKKMVIISVPFQEEVGHNKHHIHFNIDESTFNNLDPKYKVSFLFQTPAGEIHEAKSDNTNTLMVIIKKT